MVLLRLRTEEPSAIRRISERCESADAVFLETESPELSTECHCRRARRDRLQYLSRFDRPLNHQYERGFACFADMDWQCARSPWHLFLAWRFRTSRRLPLRNRIKAKASVGLTLVQPSTALHILPLNVLRTFEDRTVEMATIMPNGKHAEWRKIGK